MAKSISTVTLELDDAQFQRGIKNADDQVKKFGQTTTSASAAGVMGFGNMQGAVSKLADGASNLANKMNGVATAITGIAIGAFISNLLTSADAIKDLSESFGVSVEKILEVEAGFKKAGRSTEQMGLALATFQGSLEEARNGSAKAQAELEKFGLTEEFRAAHTDLENFNQMMRVLAANAGDASFKVAGVSLAGRSLKTMSVGDFVDGLDQANGKMGNLAASTVQASEANKKLEETAKNIKNAFLNLIAPILEAFNSIAGGANVAYIAALGLAGAMAATAASLAAMVATSTINAFKALVGLFTAGAGAMSAQAAATGIATGALVGLTAAEVNFIRVKQAEAAARVISLEATIAEARARLADTVSLQANAVATAELAAARRALLIASGQLAVAQASLAASTAGLTVATGAAGTTMAATAATGGLLAGVMATITGAFTSLGIILFRIGAIFLPVAAALSAPVWGVIAIGVAAVTAALTAATLIWKAFGDEITGSISKGYAWAKEWAGGIYDSINSTLDKIANKMRSVFGMSPKLPDIERGRPTMPNDPRRLDNPEAPVTNVPQDLKPWLAQELALRNSYEFQKQINQQAQARLQLEMALVGASEQEKTRKLGLFDAEAKHKSDLLKINQEIAVLETTIAQGGDEAAKKEGGRLAIMKQQRDELAKQTEDAVVLDKLFLDMKNNNEKNRNIMSDVSMNLSQQVQAFTQSNTNVTDRLALETKLLGLGRDQSQAAQARYDLEQRTTEKIRELTQATEKLKLLTDAQDPNRDKKIEFNNDAIKNIQVQADLDKAFLDQNIAGFQKRRSALEQLQFSQELINNAEIASINLKAEMAKLTMTSDQKTIADIKTQNELLAQQQIIKEQGLLGVDENGKQILLDLQRQKQIRDEISQTNQPLIDGTQRLIDQSREFTTGWQLAWSQWRSDAENASLQIQKSFSSFTQNIDKAIDDFIDKGKFKFADFRDSIIRDLIRIQLKSEATKLITGVGGFFGGLLGRAGGGPVSANTPYIIGEEGPEVFIPNTAGTIIPNNAMSSGSAVGGQQVIYNINAVDAMSFKQMLAQDPTFLHAVAEQGRRRLPGARA